jgi:hypothetical protein
MLKFAFLLHSASDEIREIAGYPVFAASRLRSIIKPGWFWHLLLPVTAMPLPGLKSYGFS